MAILDYAGKLVLAPMVRTGELPLRLLALRYGADLVWSPEIVDKKLITCRRVVNEKINCIDYVCDAQNKAPTVILRTHCVRERSKLVLQLGTASADLAVEAASLVAADVAGIDVNSGCPKHFSVHSGMGAALLKTPDKLVGILTALVAEVGKPNSIGISVKIRLLETPEKTFELVRRLCATGISALTVHCRMVHMRPRERAIPEDYLRGVADICHEFGVVCIANGDVACKGDFSRLRTKYNVDSAMIAVAAEKNVSCFQAEETAHVINWLEVARAFIAEAIRVDNYFTNSKYILMQMLPGKVKERQAITVAKTYEEILEALHIQRPEPVESFVQQFDAVKRSLEKSQNFSLKRKNEHLDAIGESVKRSQFTLNEESSSVSTL
ncbi:uncharacterized protein V1518DRAFT_411534 [Limtongia smithiae]|uniref:uncharacterized protein n=1 Tax=Limtongia smithiae TaxID=1125753 RepID=UPI0034CD74E2